MSKVLPCQKSEQRKYTILPTVPVTMVSELCTIGVVVVVVFVVVVVAVVAIPISIAIADCIVANVAFYLCCFVAVLLLYVDY